MVGEIPVGFKIALRSAAVVDLISTVDNKYRNPDGKRRGQGTNDGCILVAKQTCALRTKDRHLKPKNGERRPVTYISLIFVPPQNIPKFCDY